MRRACVLAMVAMVAAWLLPTEGAGAQVAVSGARPASTAGVMVGRVAGSVTDVFAGKGVVGPYLLTWRGVDAGSDVVSRDLRPLARGTDYAIDLVYGVVVFTEPLRDGQVASVRYTVNPERAVENRAAAPTPVALKLLSPGSGLRLDAIVRTDPSIAGSAQGGGFLMSLAGQEGREKSGLWTGQFVLDPFRGGSAFERGGLVLRERSASGPLGLNVGYARGGADAAGAGVAGLTPGREVIDAVGTWKGAGGVTALASFVRTTDLSTGSATTTVLQQAAAAPLPGTQVRFSHQSATTEGGGAARAETDATRVQVDRRMGGGATATATVDVQRTSGAGSTQAAITMSSRPSAPVGVQASLTARRTAAGSETTSALQMRARVSNRLSVTASAGDRDGPASADHARAVAADYTASPKVRVSGALDMRSAAGSSMASGLLAVQARPVAGAEVTGSVRVRDGSVGGAPDPLALETVRAGVALDLAHGASRLTGSFAVNPDDGGAPVRGQGGSVGITGRLGAFEASGTVSLLQEAAAGRDTEQIGLGLAWRLAKATRFDTRYQGTVQRAGSLLATDTLSLNLTHSLASRVDLSLASALAVRQDGLLPPSREVRVDARLGVRF